MKQVDKGHCKLDYDGDADLEYSDFYDFRPSYPDYKEGEEPKEGDEEISDNKFDLSLSLKSRY